MDWSSVQEEGAARRDQNAKRTKKKDRQVAEQLPPSQSVNRSGSLTYKKLVITAESLVTTTDKWLEEMERPLDDDGVSTSGNDTTSVFVVGLHACGSLTLDILRAVVRQLRNMHSHKTLWVPAGGLIVGCCYNLLRPEGRYYLHVIPVRSPPVVDCTSQTGCKMIFTESHLQLAAQMPLQWGRTPASLAEATLAARKVSWRALLSRMLPQESEERPLLSGRTRYLKRLGRLNDSAYRSWEAFIGVVEKRLEIKVAEVARDRAMESRLEVFHFLRCALGPVVESFLLLDRKLWLREQLNVSVVQLYLVIDTHEKPCRIWR